MGTWKSLESKVFFFFPYPCPLALAVNKSPAVYIYHARSKDFQEKIGGLWTGYQGFKGTVTPYAHVRHLYFWSGGTFFQDWLLVKKSSSIDPEMSEKAIISVFKSHLVNFGSFKRHIYYFVQALSRKCEVIEEKYTKAYYLALFVVSVPANGSNVAFNVVIWLSIVSVKFSTQRSTFFGEV